MAKSRKKKPKQQEAKPDSELVWLKAAYSFHSYAYRDPRSVFASAVGLPVVSPTTVLLGVASTLFRLGHADDARAFLQVAHECKVCIDPPEAVVFFRAFHQVRRYESGKWDEPAKGKVNPRIGLTNINQGTREYGLLEGPMTIFLGVPKDLAEIAKIALVNLTHLGTHDSLCSLYGNVESCAKPEHVVFISSDESPEKARQWITERPGRSVTMVTLSRFREALRPVSQHWWMSGGNDTELMRYTIPGQFKGTSRGKIYRKS